MQKFEHSDLNAPKEFEHLDLNASEEIEYLDLNAPEEIEYLDLNAPENSFIDIPSLITFIDISNDIDDEPEIYSCDEMCVEIMKEVEICDESVSIDQFKIDLAQFFYKNYQDFGVELIKVFGNLTKTLSIYNVVPANFPTLFQNYTISGILKTFFTKAVMKYPENAYAVKNKSFFIKFYISDILDSTSFKFEIVLSHQALINCNDNKLCEIRPIN